MLRRNDASLDEEKMQKILLYISIGVVAFLVGTFAVYLFLGKPSEVRIEDESVNTNELVSRECGEFSDEIDLKPFLNKWLLGEKFKDVPYCKDGFSEAAQFDERNVHPSYIDTNGDGKDELVLQTACSPTGNCDMWIFEQTDKGYRNIFVSAHGVQTFKRSEEKNKSYFDLETRMTSGATEGDLVIYRFDGDHYKPKACFTYNYLDKNSGAVLDEPLLDPRKCSQFLE